VVPVAKAEPPADVATAPGLGVEAFQRRDGASPAPVSNVSDLESERSSAPPVVPRVSAPDPVVDANDPLGAFATPSGQKPSAPPVAAPAMSLGAAGPAALKSASAPLPVARSVADDDLRALKPNRKPLLIGGVAAVVIAAIAWVALGTGGESAHAEGAAEQPAAAATAAAATSTAEPASAEPSANEATEQPSEAAEPAEEAETTAQGSEGSHPALAGDQQRSSDFAKMFQKGAKKSP
jgi:hypothetical protein